MADPLKAGDQVEWQSAQGKIVGVVKKKLTKPMTIKGHKVAASVDNPQILVESDKTKAQAAHKEEALTKINGTKVKESKTSATKTKESKTEVKKSKDKQK